jgi:hypothetical protein
MTLFECIKFDLLTKEQVVKITLLNLQCDVYYSALMLRQFYDTVQIQDDYKYIEYKGFTVGYYKYKLREYGIL